ncbi:hypothetical protein JH146_1460 [Methanocaldococcus bathoardescens]|uniref:Glycosyltransferase family 9 protein n=2 Tax=Methanocaldococcus bathoardescens TaxID=1301915 RepID=A0A076LHB4_9EURY|nr:hypothetical protein JH146_1460 [Methanocaldococcus bathoardescens]
MSTPMIKLLRKNFKDDEIEALTMQKATYEILETNPNLDNVYYFNFFKIGHFGSIKYLFESFRGKYDVSITIYPSYPKHYHVLSYLIGAKRRIAHKFNKGYFKEFHFLNTDLINAEEDKHNVINNVNLLKPLDIVISENEIKKMNLELYLTDEDEEKGRIFFEENGIDYDKAIFIHNGSSRVKKGSEKRRLPLSKLKELINLILRKDYQILFNIGPEEKYMKKFLIENFKSLIDKKIYLVEGFRIREVASIIKRCKKVFVTDSGIMHISAALGKETVCFFGPTDVRKVHPWNTKHEIITAGFECSPCYWHYSMREFECNHSEYKKNSEVFPCTEKIDIKKS